MQLQEDFELSTDFLNLAEPSKIPISNTQYIIYVCGIEENAIIPKKGKTGVELRYYELDEYPSITTDQNYELHK